MYANCCTLHHCNGQCTEDEEKGNVIIFILVWEKGVKYCQSMKKQ